MEDDEEKQHESGEDARGENATMIISSSEGSKTGGSSDDKKQVPKVSATEDRRR